MWNKDRVADLVNEGRQLVTKELLNAGIIKRRSSERLFCEEAGVLYAESAGG